MTTRVRSLFRNLVSRRHVERALDHEVQSCLEILIDQKISSGMSPEDARRASLMELGGVEQVKEHVRRQRTGAVIDGIRQDLTYAIRRLGREPGFTATAVLILALTTGPVIAIAGVADWMFFRPLSGVYEPDRLIAVNFGTPRGERGRYTVSRVSYLHLDQMAAASPALQAMAGWQPANVAVGRPGEAPRPTNGEYVSASYFDVMGVRLSAGRPFRAEEDRHVTAPVVAVIGASLAERLFGTASPLNETIDVNGSRVTVVGVAPAAFSGIDRSDRSQIWLPGIMSRRLENFLPDAWAYESDRGPFYMHVARLAPGGTRERADVELTRAALALSEKDPSARKYESVRPLIQESLPGPARFKSVFAVLFGAAAALVLLSAANLANLFVFRAVRRSQECAVRRALGASGARLARLHLAEAGTIALGGAVSGIAVALVLKSWIGEMLFAGQLDLPLILDQRLLWLTLTVALVVAMILGTLPARLATRMHATGVLGRWASTSTPRVAKVRTSLAVVQLALSVVLLVGALLFTTTLRNIRAIDPGFDSSGVLMVTHEFRMRGYQEDRIAQYLTDVLNQVAPPA